MQRVREINSHSSPPSSHRKPTIMAVAAVTVDRTIHIQFRRGMGRDGQSGKANMQKSDTNCKLRFCSITESECNTIIQLFCPVLFSHPVSKT